MKLIVLAVSLALAALSVYASGPPVQGNDSKTAPATQTQTVLSSNETVSTATDSPLVLAAKASRRSVRKSTTVITNDTLVRTGGHFTTTTSQAPIVNPRAGRSAWDQMAAEVQRTRTAAAAAAAGAAEARKLDEQKMLAAARQAAAMEGDTPEAIYSEQPAVEGGTMQTLKPSSPSTTGQQQKPPQ